MCITAICSAQVGCVLGKGGSIVTRVRDSTGAMVRVLEQNKGQRRLESGEEVDEVIEVQGLPQSCDSALQAVADLLRQYQVGLRHPYLVPFSWGTGSMRFALSAVHCCCHSGLV